MTNRLTVQFLGICAFIKEPGGKILVVLPDASTVPAEVGEHAKDLKTHHAFLRWRRDDIDATASTIATAETRGAYGMVLLKGDEVRIDGPLKAGPLVVAESFVNYIPSMDDISPSRPQTSRRVVARMMLDRGELSAEPSETGHTWVFKPLGDTEVDDEARKQAREFYNVVRLKIDVDPSSKQPVRITTSRGVLVGAVSAANVEIAVGNLEDPFRLVEEEVERRRQDIDFLYQYEITEKPPSPAQRLIPTRSAPPHEPRGASVECFAARWGGIKPGVQS